MLHTFVAVVSFSLVFIVSVTVSFYGSVASEWRRKSSAYLSTHNRSANASIAKDADLLHQKISNISRDSHPACVQWLIEHFQGATAKWWRSRNPGFLDPHKYTTITNPTTSRGTTTVTTPLTTSTTTTPQPASTTSLPTDTTQLPVSCTVCKDLDCLLAPQVKRCPPHSHFCLITIADVGRSRSISRGCADQAKCDGTVRPAGCANVESGYTSDTVCEFCCSVDNCNRPPALVPASSTRYPPP